MTTPTEPPAKAPEVNPAVEPIAFLLGTWRGEGHGSYPTIEDFHYGEEMTFRHNGKAFLAYSQRSWSLDDGRPLAAESGYWRPQPDGTIEVVMSHPTGICEIYVGPVNGRTIELVSDVIVRTRSAKEVTGIKRLYGMVGVELMYAIDMAAMGQRLQSHLAATLQRIGD